MGCALMGGGHNDFANWEELIGSCYPGRRNSVDKGMEVGEHRVNDFQGNDYGFRFSLSRNLDEEVRG